MKKAKKKTAPRGAKKTRAKSKAKRGTKTAVKTRKTRKTVAKKKTSRRAPKTPPAGQPKSTVIPPPNGVLLGRVEDYFAKIGVIALTLQHEVHLGDHLHILGHTTHLEQTVDSMQIEHQPVGEAKANDAVGIKVTARVRKGDHVYLIP